MAEQSSPLPAPKLPAVRTRRVWELLIIPLVVGIILAVVTFVIPRILEVGKRLSYSIDKPTDYLSERLQGVTIQVNGFPTSNLFVVKVRIWNSGSAALKDVSVLFDFDTADHNFRILNVAHATKPEREFGSITQANPDINSTRLTYSLLNRGDEDTISFLTNESVEPKIYAKAEDMRIKRAAFNLRVSPLAATLISLVVGLIGLAGSLLGFLLSAAKERQMKNEWLRREWIRHQLLADESEAAKQQILRKAQEEARHGRKRE
jgi:hypothetical protein